MTKKFINYLKQNRIPIPIGIGMVLSKIPYELRPGVGKLYKDQKESISKLSEFSREEKESFIYNNFINIFTHAYHNVKFYKDLYDRNQIKPEDIKTFSDIQKIPVITKQDLFEYSLEDRSFEIKDRLLVNTGGSSGKALSFYMDPRRYGNEWAHIHDMWSKFGFRPSDLKLSFDGRAKKNNKIVYDFARNSLIYDIYADKEEINKQLLNTIKKHPIKYLHGYPSAIYEFALSCKNNNELLSLLRKNLKAAFLSSEFPSPHYRDEIEETFGIETQSFYGHTETCVLAVEVDKFVYDAYQTYGYAEAISKDNGYNLIGTSYFNYASPLIRYNTEDLVEPVFSKNSEILEKFKIKDGRSGEFILDKSNNRIPLTGLIYGRHHTLFNICEHIQVYQDTAGYATILYVSKKTISPDVAVTYFNSDSIDIDFTFKQVDSPILTNSGKINLKIKTLED